MAKKKSNIEKYNESLTQEQRTENASKAGIASGISRNQNRKFQDILESLLAMPMKKGKLAEVETIKDFASLKGVNLTAKEAVAYKVILDYFETGNPKLLEFIRDTLGEKAPEKMDIAGSIPVVISGEDGLED